MYIYIYYGEFCHMHHVRNVIYNIRYISYIVYYEKQLWLYCLILYLVYYNLLNVEVYSIISYCISYCSVLYCIAINVCILYMHITRYFACKLTWTHVRVHTNICIYIYTYQHACTQKNIITYIHTYVHTYLLATEQPSAACDVEPFTCS